jgi:hypothetical protein
MHIDEAAHHLVLGFCMERGGPISGGEFVLPEYDVYWPMEDNLLWWFANAAVHGTAVLSHPEGTEGRLTMAHSIPRRLWSLMTTKGVISRSAPGRRSEPVEGDDDGAESEAELVQVVELSTTL